jgi:hypothetical protein
MKVLARAPNAGETDLVATAEETQCRPLCHPANALERVAWATTRGPAAGRAAEDAKATSRAAREAARANARVDMAPRVTMEWAGESSQPENGVRRRLETIFQCGTT